VVISSYKIPLPPRCTYFLYRKGIYYIFVFLVTNRLCCYCNFYLKKINTQQLHDIAMVVCLLISGYVSEVRNICHVIQFSFLFSCVVSIWIGWTFLLHSILLHFLCWNCVQYRFVTQPVIWSLHCLFGLPSCICSSTDNSFVTLLFLYMMVTGLYCFWAHLQSNFNKRIIAFSHSCA
jgi:hypothetical protein